MCMLSPVSPPASSEEGLGHVHAPSKEEMEPDMSTAMLDDPIVGVEVVLSDHNGAGARPARPLPSPKQMSPAQRAIHDLTHLPFDEGCEICRATRGLNAQHLASNEHMRTIPLLVADYCFLRWSVSSVTRTVLVMRLYPYKV